MWNGVCGMTVLGTSAGQTSVNPEGTAVVVKVIIHIFGAMDAGYAYLLTFLICSEHLFWILSLAYQADTQVGGLAGGRSGVFKLQNCPLAIWNVLQ